MIIEGLDNEKGAKFITLHTGEAFKCKGKLFIKTTEVIDEDYYDEIDVPPVRNAVCLSTGFFETLYNEDIVERVNAVITIKE